MVVTSSMAYLHAVRVHEIGDRALDRLTTLVRAIDGSYVFAKEVDATRVHYQGWIRCDVKPQALRVRLKKAFPECVGNKGYSLTAVKDEDAYKRYILKGTKEEMAQVVCHCGIEITSEYLAAEHRAYWSKAEKAGKSNRSVVEEVSEWVAAQEWPDVLSKEYAVAERVCDVITSKKKPLNMYYAEGVYNTVMYRASDEFKEIMIRKIISKRQFT